MRATSLTKLVWRPCDGALYAFQHLRSESSRSSFLLQCIFFTQTHCLLDVSWWASDFRRTLSHCFPTHPTWSECFLPLFNGSFGFVTSSSAWAGVSHTFPSIYSRESASCLRSVLSLLSFAFLMLAASCPGTKTPFPPSFPLSFLFFFLFFMQHAFHCLHA